MGTLITFGFPLFALFLARSNDQAKEGAQCLQNICACHVAAYAMLRTKGGIMTKASGRKAHSNGAQFEDYLERVIFAEALRSGYFARVDKQNPTYFATRSRAGVTFKPRAASGADWIALGGRNCTWNYIAIEGKHTNDKSLALSELKPDQIAHLNAAEEAGQLGLLLVRFEVFTYACRWSSSLFTSSGGGFSMKRANLPHRTEIAGDRTLADILNTWSRTA